MLPRRNPLKTLALAAALLCAGRPVFATDLRPSISGYDINSLTLAWDTTNVTLVAAISTSASFATSVSSGSLTGNATTYSNLNLDATYYFKIKIRTEADAAYSQVSISTQTNNAPSGQPYFDSFRFSAASSYTATAGLGWDTAGNPDWTNYEVQYADNSGFTGASTRTYQLPPVSLGGLKANTTYYFKVRARAFRGAATSYTAANSTPTLPMDLAILGETVYETTTTVSWTPLSSSTQALNSEGYRLIYSLSESMTPLVSYSSTSVPGTSSFLLSPLSRNTQYFYRAGALGWNGAANYSGVRTFTTLPDKIPQAPAKIAVADWSATLGWPALPAAPPSASAAGYRLEASTTASFTGGLTLSSATADITRSTLTITLDANTTYYFRAASLNAAGGANYTAGVASVTLAAPVPLVLTWSAAQAQSLTVYFTPNAPVPASLSCLGYRLEASSAPFGAGAAVISSVTYDNQLDRLTIPGLVPNISYYLRLGTLNWQNTPNYTALPAVTTVPGNPPTGALLKEVSLSSAALTFIPVTDSDGHVAEASLDQYFNVYYSSSSPDRLVSTLTITGLPSNTQFYFRLGALFNGATVYATPSPSQAYTLPQALTGLSISAVSYSSVTVSWAAPPPAAYYKVDAATSAAFSPVVFISSTANPAATALAITGLAPNTSYYFRAGSFNAASSGTYVTLSATSTLANPPTTAPFGVSTTTLTINWGGSSNPPDTRYRAEISFSSGSGYFASSTTVLPFATFTGLVPNTTHWLKVTAINRLNRETPAVYFSSVATGAKDPGYAAYSALGITSVTVNWTNGGNPAGTYFRVGISSSPGFDTAFSSDTLSYSAPFSGLVSNTSYYLRVSALNLDYVATDPPVSLGAALTRPAAPDIYTVTTQAFTSFMADGFSVSWRHNGNSSLTAYEVQLSTAYDFSVLSASRAATGETCAFSDLPLNTTYWARVVAHGQNGFDNPVSASTGPARTLSDSQAWAYSQYDKTVALDTSYGTISLFLPKGAIASSTEINLTPLFPPYSFPAPDSAVSVLAPTGVGLAITHLPRTTIFNAITITLPYRPADLGGADRSKLVVALYDEKNSLWIPLPSVSDTARNRVVAQTWHLSTFQLMEAASEAGLSNVKIYPNPYRPNSVSDVMHFTSMTSFAKVRIYTFLGELVRELRADVNGMAIWDGLNRAGAKAASGVYIAFIQSSDKKKNKSYKIALER